jgi:DNA-binding transcriptional ArsR family regulator
VLAHGSRGDLCRWVPYARRLAALGYVAFPFAFRNFGDSQDRGYPLNRRWGGDVAAAVQAARVRGATKVFVIGESLGGSAVVLAAANIRPPLAGVVSVSGAADLAGPSCSGIVHRSVHCTRTLDRTFFALSDPTRRAILELLGDRPSTITELAEPFGLTLNGVKKHVTVLEDAGLVITEKVGRARECRLGPAQLQEVTRWIEEYRRAWQGRLDRFEAYVEQRTAGRR